MQQNLTNDPPPLSLRSAGVPRPLGVQRRRCEQQQLHVHQQPKPPGCEQDYFPANTRVARTAPSREPPRSPSPAISQSHTTSTSRWSRTSRRPRKTYILRICGSDAPTQYPDGTAIEAGAKHFSVPVKGVALGWSTPVPFFEQLDLMDKVKLADASYTHSPCMHDAMKAGTIKDGSSSFASTAAAQTDVELVSAAVPPGQAAAATRTSSSTPVRRTPLGRAEWIKFLATFFNEEDRANLVFSREKAAYDATKALATAAAALHEVTRQEEVRLDRTALEDRPYPHSLETRQTIQLKYCTDAGMEPVTDLDGSGAPKIDVGSTDLNTALADVDVIIDETYARRSRHEPPTPRRRFSPHLGITLKDGAVLLRVDRELYDTGSPSTTTPGLESAVIRPAHVLQGLVHAVWPNSVKEIPDSCVDYFRDMTAGESDRQDRRPHPLHKVGQRQRRVPVHHQHPLRRRDGRPPRFPRGQAVFHRRHRRRPRRRLHRRVNTDERRPTCDSTSSSSTHL